MKTVVIRWEDERGEERETVGALVRLGDEGATVESMVIPMERIVAIEIVAVS